MAVIIILLLVSSIAVADHETECDYDSDCDGEDVCCPADGNEDPHCCSSFDTDTLWLVVGVVLGVVTLVSIGVAVLCCCILKKFKKTNQVQQQTPIAPVMQMQPVMVQQMVEPPPAYPGQVGYGHVPPPNLYDFPGSSQQQSAQNDALPMKMKL